MQCRRGRHTLLDRSTQDGGHPAAYERSITTARMSTDRSLLRHALATLAYRAAKTLRDAPPEFAAYDGGGRTPLAIVAHLGDLIVWSISMANGTRVWNETQPGSWADACERFFAALQRFDDFLASETELSAPCAKLFQGPIADALTHTGQLAMLRRMAGAPTQGESYYAAEIVDGRVGSDQAPPRTPFLEG
jgi:hypothetical protein